MRNVVHQAVLVALLAMIAVGPVRAQEERIADGSLVDWPTFSTALAKAAVNGKIILIDVFADTCPWCRKLQSEIYTKIELQSYVYETFELGRINIGIDDDTLSFKGYTLSSAELGAGFGATGTPTTIFMEPDGEYITRLPGFHEYDEFLQVLRFVGSQSFREMSFAEYVEKMEASSALSSGAAQD